MDAGLIWKIVGIGILVSVSGMVLNKTGRDEQAMLVTLAGIVTVVLMLMNEIASLFESLRTMFGL